MYWTPAKMLLLADVDESSFVNTAYAYKYIHTHQFVYNSDIFFLYILLYCIVIVRASYIHLNGCQHTGPRLSIGMVFADLWGFLL